MCFAYFISDRKACETGSKSSAFAEENKQQLQNKDKMNFENKVVNFFNLPLLYMVYRLSHSKVMVGVLSSLGIIPSYPGRTES